MTVRVIVTVAAMVLAALTGAAPASAAPASLVSAASGRCLNVRGGTDTAGTPLEIQQRLNAEIVKHSGTPEMIEKLRLAGCAPVIQTIDEIVAFREADTKQMAELIKTAQIKIE